MPRTALRQETARAEPGTGTRADQDGTCAAVRRAHAGRMASRCDGLARMDEAEEAVCEDREAHFAHIREQGHVSDDDRVTGPNRRRHARTRAAAIAPVFMTAPSSSLRVAHPARPDT